MVMTTVKYNNQYNHTQGPQPVCVYPFGMCVYYIKDSCRCGVGHTACLCLTRRNDAQWDSSMCRPAELLRTMGAVSNVVSNCVLQ